MRKAKILLAAGGIGLLAVLVVRIGPATLAAQLAAIRWALPVLVVLGLVKLGLRTWSWAAALEADGITVSTRQLFGANVASQSMAYLSAMGSLLGDPMKPLLLRNSAGVEASTPATLAETSVYWFTSVLLGLAGTLAGILVAAKGPKALTILFVSSAVFVIAMSLLLTRTPFLPNVGAFFCKWKGHAHRSCYLLRKAGAIEDRIRSFRFRHPNAVGRMFVLDLLVQFVMVAEVLTVMAAIGIHIGVFKLLAVEAATRMVKIVSFYVPARIGTDEAGAAGAFLLFGMAPAAGFTLAIARRAQALVWAAVGLAWLGLSGAAAKATAARSREHGKEAYDAGAAFVARTS